MTIPFPIVGIGASAGGLEALQTLVGAIPNDTGLAYVIIQHLAPDHPSIMDKLLRDYTKVPVTQIADGNRVEPDHIYLIPPGPFVELRNGRFNLIDHPREEGVRTPIDRFFSSLAEQCGRDAFAVVLSGTGSDGTLGVRAVKQAGGIAMVQQSASARFPGMPDSAAATGLVDFALPPEAIPGRILDILEHRDALAADDKADELHSGIADRLPELLKALDPDGSHGFGSYKPPTLIRRILRRMTILRQSSIDGYIRKLNAEADERELLRKDFLIGVTEFFRDPEVYASIERKIIAELVKADDNDPIRIWVPGCATGEEAYSLAILLIEEMERQRRPRACQVFGTDVDMNSLRHARAGVYSKSVTSQISPERMERFFRQDNGGYQVSSELRQMCVFAPHDILSDPPFSRLNMISCRNVMIYLTGEAQHGILPRFHYGLKLGGYLLLGPSESLGRNEELFEVVDRTARLFQRNDHASTRFTALDSRPAPARSLQIPKSDLWQSRSIPATEQDVEVRAEQAFLQSLAPPFALVDPSGRILYLSEAMTAYVKPARGAPEMTTDGFLSRELRLPIQAVLTEARETGEPAEARNVVSEIDGQPQLYDILAKPLREDANDAILLSLREVRLRDGAEVEPNVDRAADTELVERKLTLANQQLEVMEREYTGAEQQLRSANEELLSMNEELQSSNEELETSREELQSINEELETINSELSENNRQLTRANSDMRNLLESTDIATLFLDAHLRVRLFTPPLSEIYGVRDRDIGRDITDLASRVVYPELADDARSVMQTLQPIDREVGIEVTNQSFALRMRPYRTIDDRLDGVVITFVDITGRKRNEDQLSENARVLREQFAELETLYDSIPVGLSVVDADLNYLRVNATLAEINGVPPEDHIGKKAYEVLPDIARSVRDPHAQVFATGEALRGIEIEGETPKEPGKKRTWIVDFFPIRVGDEVFAVGSCVMEITQQRALERKAARAAEAVVESEERLRRIFDTVPVFISMHAGPDNTYVYSNQANNERAGNRDLIGKPFLEAFPEHVGTQIAETFDQVYRTGSPITVPEVSATLFNPDGQELDAHYFHSVVPYYDENGETAGVMSFAYDITEQVESRTAVEQSISLIAESEARMGRLFDQAPAIISIFEGPELRYYYVNAAHGEAVGVPAEKLIGKPMRKALPELEGQGVFERFERVYATGVAEETDELPAELTKDGRTRYFKQMIEPWFQGDGSVGGVMSFNYEITDLVEAREQVFKGERRLRTIQDSLQSFVGLLDNSGILIEVNQLALTRAGLTPDDVIGKPFWDCWWWSYDAKMQAQLKEWFNIALTGGTVREECRVRMRDTEFVTIDFHLEPSFDDNGDIVEVIPSAIDVTEWREAEARKDTLLAELQHRVKNVLATVQAIARFTARTAPSKEALIDSLQQRLSAISRTHDALTHSDWIGKHLFDIVRDEMGPYIGEETQRLNLKGEDVLIAPSNALSIALALHELTTNAAKYGALSNSKGEVTIDVQSEYGALRSLEWRETGGPAVTAPEATGFGSFLLERVLTEDLDATVDLNFASSGVVCRIDFG